MFCFVKQVFQRNSTSWKEEEISLTVVLSAQLCGCSAIIKKEVTARRIKYNLL